MLDGRQRARSEGERATRRQAILGAARALFEKNPYAEISMAGVAGRAGLAKGTLYLYFPTKESLFLALAEEQLLAWFDSLDAALDGPAGPTIEEAVALIGATLTRHPALARLLAILHTVLERNIDLDTARALKRRTLARLLRSGELLERGLPFLAPGEGAATLLRAYALVIGLQHLSDPAPVVREALREPGMEPFAIDFERELLTGLRALLIGAEQLAIRKGHT